ncbi:MAG: copper amine oxidase N-terminal domain-containing protein [Clostridia bacterium]|nr:copper amine oxidase N-terminal domain-containing protein [Clostridia bacterium]
MFKKSGKVLCFCLIVALAVCAFSLSVFAADGNVAFYDVVNGDDAYDGKTADTAKRSLGSADGNGVASVLAGFGKEGGTLVLPCKGRPGADYTFPAMEGPLTITAVWNGVDYRNYLPMDNPSAGVLKGAGSTTNPLGISITIGTDTTFTDMILFQEDEQNSIIVPAGLTLTITDTVDLLTKPGNEHYWRVVVEKGGTAILSEEALKLLTIENRSGTVIKYGDPTATPLDIGKVSTGEEEGNVVFYDVVAGNDSYNGRTAEAAKKNLDGSGVVSILTTFGKEGGTLVLSGKGRPSADYTFPAMEGSLTITAVWKGVDYRNYLPMDNPSAGVLKGAGSTTNPLGVSITIGTDTTLTDMILFQEDEQNSIIVPAGLTLTITDSVDLMTKPGNEHYWRVVVEQGGTAILSEEALKLLTIENSGTVLKYGDASKTPVAIGKTAAGVELKMTLGKTAYTLNGETKTMDVAPIIRNERTMLPVRYVAEALGAEIAWDGATSTATLKTVDTEIKITVGAKDATVNGKSVALDSPAFIENDRTYMPVRFVAETLGGTVAWDGATSTATITK